MAPCCSSSRWCCATWRSRFCWSSKLPGAGWSRSTRVYQGLPGSTRVYQGRLRRGFDMFWCKAHSKTDVENCGHRCGMWKDCLSLYGCDMTWTSRLPGPLPQSRAELFATKLPPPRAPPTSTDLASSKLSKVSKFSRFFVEFPTFSDVVFPHFPQGIGKSFRPQLCCGVPHGRRHGVTALRTWCQTWGISACFHSWNMLLFSQVEQRRDMIYDIWSMIYDIWSMIYDIWYMIYDIWYDMIGSIYIYIYVMYMISDQHLSEHLRGMPGMWWFFKLNLWSFEEFVSISLNLSQRQASQHSSASLLSQGTEEDAGCSQSRQLRNAASSGYPVSLWQNCAEGDKVSAWDFVGVDTDKDIDQEPWWEFIQRREIHEMSMIVPK